MESVFNSVFVSRADQIEGGRWGGRGREREEWVLVFVMLKAIDEWHASEDQRINASFQSPEFTFANLPDSLLQVINT